MAREGTLKQFHEALAQRIREAAHSESDARLGIEVGASRYLLRLEDSGEVLPVPQLSPVPLARSWFVGLANVRGNLVSVIDFAAFSGEAAVTRSAQTRLVLLTERFGARCGLLVARLLGLKSMRSFQPAEGAQAAAPWIGAAWRDKDGAEWRELDLEALAAHETFLQASL